MTLRDVADFTRILAELEQSKQQVSDLQAKLKQSEAGAAVMRNLLEKHIRTMEDNIAAMIEAGDIDDNVIPLMRESLERDKAALSTSAGVAMLERATELEKTLGWALYEVCHWTILRYGGCQQCMAKGASCVGVGVIGWRPNRKRFDSADRELRQRRGAAVAVLHNQAPPESPQGDGVYRQSIAVAAGWKP
jgi:hypothetical protein